MCDTCNNITCTGCTSSLTGGITFDGTQFICTIGGGVQFQINEGDNLNVVLALLSNQLCDIYTGIEDGTLDGSEWYVGSGVPSDANNNDGDLYLDSDNGDVYKKVAGTWGVAVANIKGANGTNGTNGTDGTDGTDGNDGNDGPQGPPGPAGSLSWFETGDPGGNLNVSLDTNEGWLMQKTSDVTSFLLPATAAIGEQIHIIGIGRGEWEITQAAGQSVVLGDTIPNETTVGISGYVSLNPNTYTFSMELVCIEANTKWQITAFYGGATTDPILN